MTNEQMDALLSFLSATDEDTIDCDTCLDQFAAFAEADLLGLGMPTWLTPVAEHLRQCSCCQDEYEILVRGIRELRTS